MTSILLEDLSDELAIQVDDPEERFITNGVSWEQYEELLGKLVDSSRYRLTYLDGTLEIMSNSRRHEKNKTNIGTFLETYLIETRTPFWGLGSMTLCRQKKQAGTEPDECYCIETEKEFPDLAIEVVISSGGISKLAVYKRLGIKEIWFWQNNKLSVYHLRDEEYEKIPKSELLPNLDLDLLAQYVLKTNPLEAVLEFREIIRQSL